MATLAGGFDGWVWPNGIDVFLWLWTYGGFDGQLRSSTAGGFDGWLRRDGIDVS